MRNYRDLNIYNVISEELSENEVLLGSIDYTFHFSEALYSAIWTEALPMSPIEKAVSQLLLVDECLTINQIGDILGLNVYNSDYPKRYLDLAERELLTDVLESMCQQDPGMIDSYEFISDNCKLTAIGKEYAKKKSKFRTTPNKMFSVFLDHTTGLHILAKKHIQNFQYTNSLASCKMPELTEEELKQIVTFQVPEMHDTKKQNSFTNAVLQKQQVFELALPIAILYNTVTSQYKLIVINQKLSCIENKYTEWINEDETLKSDLIDKFIDNYRKDIEETGKKVITDNISTEYIDEYALYSGFDSYISANESQFICICLPHITKQITIALKRFVETIKKTGVLSIIFVPESLEPEFRTETENLKNSINGLENLYFLPFNLDEFIFAYQSSGVIYIMENLYLKTGGIMRAFFRKTECSVDYTEKIKSVMTVVQSTLVAEISATLAGFDRNNLNDTSQLKKEIAQLNSYEKKIKDIVSYCDLSIENTDILKMINELRESRIEVIEQFRIKKRTPDEFNAQILKAIAMTKNPKTNHYELSSLNNALIRTIKGFNFKDYGFEKFKEYCESLSNLFDIETLDNGVAIMHVKVDLPEVESVFYKKPEPVIVIPKKTNNEILPIPINIVKDAFILCQKDEDGKVNTKVYYAMLCQLIKGFNPQRYGGRFNEFYKNAGIFDVIVSEHDKDTKYLKLKDDVQI